MDMPFLKLLSCFLLLTSFNNLASCEVDIPIYYNHSCTINNNFSSDSPYQFNLEYLLLSMYSKAAGADTTPEFYTTTFPSTNMNDGNDVFGEFLCRGDVPIGVCQNCVQDATYRIASECPNNKEAIIWYDYCSLRYSDRSFFSALHQLPTTVHIIASCPNDWRYTACLPSPNSSADAKAYVVPNETLSDAVLEASTSSGTKKFATKEANLSSDGESVYTLVECTPDLPPQFCTQCLYGLMKLIPRNHSVYSGRIIQNPSCNLRFAGQRFYYKGNLPPSDIFSQGNVTKYSLSFPFLSLSVRELKIRLLIRS